MDPAVHRACPLEEAPEVVAFAPHKFPEFQEADLGHLHAGVGFDAPQQVGAAPGGQTMAFGGVPQEAETVAHVDIIPARSGSASWKKNLEPLRARRCTKENGSPALTGMNPVGKT